MAASCERYPAGVCGNTPPRRPRSLDREDAFGPITGAFFAGAGAGARESVSEHDLGLGYPIGVEADTFARTIEHALEARGVPFAQVGGEDRDVSLGGAKWILCATSGGMNPELYRVLAQEASAGALITLGPREPVRDGALRPLAEPFDLARLRGAHASIPVVLEGEPAAADDAVSRAIIELPLPTYACDPEGIYATVHEDAAGRARVLFVINPGDADVVARVSIGGASGRAVDVIGDAVFEARRGAFEVRMKPRTVRMLAL